MIPILKKKWTETRPDSCKASGVGKACEAYLKYCLPPPNLKTEEAVQLAWNTVSTFQKALRDAKQKIKPKDKTGPDTNDLIDDWLKQIKEYQTGLIKVVKKEETKEREYQEKVRAWGERKESFLKHFQVAAKDFDYRIQQGKKMVQAADLLAKKALASPEAAKVCIGNIQKLLENLKQQPEEMAKKNEEALKVFDPHRSSGSESATKLGINDEDAKPFAGVFTAADTLRKRMVEQEKTMLSLHRAVESSLKQANVALLSETERLVAFIDLAAELQEQVRTLTKRLSDEGVGPKTIFGAKTYAYKDSFASSLKEAGTSNAEAALVRMTQRHDQVKDIVESLKATFQEAFELAKRGIASIPGAFHSDPKIKFQIEGVKNALREGKEYVDKFAKAFAEAEGPFAQAVLKLKSK